MRVGWACLAMVLGEALGRMGKLTRMPEHSALFERMVNEAWRIRPGIKMLFSSGPYDIINCINRNDL